jgi:GDPmannose 4,6-dehydratase
MKRALITGLTGMDGSHLADLLLDKGYEVHGIVRRHGTWSLANVDHILDRVTLHYADITDQYRLFTVINEARPDEVYNLAAETHVGESFDNPDRFAMATGVGAMRVFEAVRRYAPEARVYQASTSELFGNVPAPQGDETPFKPASPYACAKLYAHKMADVYRKAHGIWIACGILMNHESPRRGREFVTRKVARAVARIAAGHRERLELGNLEARRDWGWAPDYVEAMWRILQLDEPRDMVLGTGESHSVRQLARTMFECAGLNWRDHVDTVETLRRPADVDHLEADPALARELIGWKPTVGFEELCRRMVEAEMAAVAQ